MRKCVLYERDCCECGECNRCDLDLTKTCNNCCKCIDRGADYSEIVVDEILME